jgi:predicted nucleic acid-binding protein
MKTVIMDTGPLVAWFCPKDTHHEWALEVFEQLPAGALVCEAVLTETCHLVAKDGVPRTAILRLVERQDLRLVPLAAEIAAIRSLMETYSDVPMDFADACVTRLAEMFEDSTACTADSDFPVYRKDRRTAISLIAPFVA